MNRDRHFLHTNRLRHDAKEYGDQIKTSDEEVQRSFQKALSLCNTTLETLLQKYPTFIITNINTKRLERKEYYILESSNATLHYHKQQHTHNDSYSLELKNPDIYFNKKKRNEDYINTFLGILDTITTDLKEKRAFLFIKEQET